MLYGFEVENFLSIRDRQIMDLRVARNVRTEHGLLRPIWGGASDRAPLAVAFFGANAAGKSNVLRAISFVASFVQSSFTWQAGQSFQFSKFANEEALDQPTRFVVHFGGPKVLPTGAEQVAEESKLPDECAYTYELEIASADPPVVLRETLSYSPNGNRKRIFERVGAQVKGGAGFGLSGDYKSVDKILRKDASIIATLAQLNHPVALLLRAASSTIVSNIGPMRASPNDELMVQWYVKNPHHLERLNQEISRLDVGISSASFAPYGTQQTIHFMHEGLTAPIPLFWESEGTRQFMRIFPWIGVALETGGVAVIDELDANIHPKILPEILSWFYDPNKNDKGAQLWFTCQAASLLEDLTKEQVFFCEKDRNGKTAVFSLKDIAGVRRVDNFYRKYSGGTYGAIPRVG